jgi:hypothetical protein
MGYARLNLHPLVLQVFDGAPPENLYGSDLRMGFIDLGYDLFRDKDRLKSKFIAADVFDPDSELKQLDGQIDVVHAGSFFHLFNLEDQERVAKRIVKLLRPQPGSLVLGRQLGNTTPGEYPRRDGEGSRYRHDEASWEEMWNVVGRETGTKWKVEAQLARNEIPLIQEKARYKGSSVPPGICRLRFAVRRE